jgi:pimeloyl-ACP methyl ester carboxylesterase
MLRRQMIAAAFAAPVLSGPALAAPRAVAPRARRRVEVVAGDGTRLYHRDWGEGRPVVFAASWALPSEMWAYQVAHLADRGYRCIAFDRRGHGRSDTPAAGYDMDTLADDLAAVVAQLDLRDVTLVGHSAGAAEVLRYLGRHGSARVRSVVLLAPAAPYLVQTPDNPFGAPIAAYEARMAEWARDFPAWAEANKAPFFTPQTSPALAAWLFDQMLEINPAVAIATFRALLGKDLRPDLARIDRPMLILQGDRDASAPLPATGARVAAGVRGATLKVYPGAPHGLFVTHMAQVNADLEPFLAA